MTENIMTVDERYTCATHARRLVVDAEHRSDVDVLVAAGWSGARLGMALLRLHSEWDGATRRGVVCNVIDRLHSLPAVRRELVRVVSGWGVASPLDVVCGVLVWWLDGVCPVCHGVTREQIKGTPMLSLVKCPACRGSGKKSLPHGETGRRLADEIDTCLYSARRSLKKRLQQH